ncbi:hypothetical protein H312_03265 [Anncaliia algerae PRA339]|uniref:Uncharacterized protein n=1 Tax=Anncaliia algerae PRA339 TaxID=1288291 RepID=A0A059EWC5_9MICR|nr:hypothetical protein H312_03265 [Anncaliia algerae PRA339]
MKELSQTNKLIQDSAKRIKNTIFIADNHEKNEDYYNLESLIIDKPNDVIQNNKDIKLYIKNINNEIITLNEILNILKDKLLYYETNVNSLEGEENIFLLERLSFLAKQMFEMNDDVVRSKNEEIISNRKRINELEYENKKYKEIIFELARQIKPNKEAERVLNDLKNDIKFNNK